MSIRSEAGGEDSEKKGEDEKNKAQGEGHGGSQVPAGCSSSSLWPGL